MTQAFDRCKDEPHDKCISGEVGIAVIEAYFGWNNLLKDNPIAVALVSFLSHSVETESVKVFKRDEWTQLIDLIAEHDTSLKDYNESSSFPVLFDDFFEWARSFTPELFF